MRKSEDSGSGRILALFIMGIMILSAFGLGLGTEEEPRAAESAQLEDTEVIEGAEAAPVTEGSTRAVSNMVVLNQATGEMPGLFVGKLDYSFNVTLESIFEDDEDDRNGVLPHAPGGRPWPQRRRGPGDRLARRASAQTRQPRLHALPERRREEGGGAGHHGVGEEPDREAQREQPE